MEGVESPEYQEEGESKTSTTPDQGLLLSAISELESLSETNIVNQNETMQSVGCSSTQSPERSATTLESPMKSTMPAPGTPLTPTANLKVLVAAASSALDRELAECTARKEIFKEGGDYDSMLSTGRKMKSLALLCKRFLEVAEQDIGTGNEFSLEMMASKLGINRRRIYDIINVMEALEMISKQSKNWYRWLGRGELVQTLAKLKSMAGDDPDVRPFFEADEEEDKENQQPTSHRTTRKKQNCDDSGVQCDSHADHDAIQAQAEEENDSVFMDSSSSAQPPDLFTRSVRYDKSLGVLCQKFVMLFLVSPMNEVTLEQAGRYLVPDSQEDQLYVSVSHSSNPKTKVRRLYDIANILTSLGIIKKKVFVGPYNYKKPGYVWSGPDMREINATCKQKAVSKSGMESTARKSRTVRTPTHSAIVRKPAVNSRPPLQQQEQQQPEPDSEAHRPSSDGSTSFKRSLSFDEQNKLQPRVLARPLCSKQVDYLREMKEFEAEVQKHSHRYPNVANIFRDFIQKYQSTLEHAAANYGRFILPKTPSPDTSQLKAQQSGVIPPIAEGQLQQSLVFEHAGGEEQSPTKACGSSPVAGGSSSMAVTLQPALTSTPTSSTGNIKKESSEEALVGGDVHTSEVPPHLLGKPLPPPKFPVASIPVFQGVEPADTASQTVTTVQAPLSSPTTTTNVLSASDVHPQEVAFSVDSGAPTSSTALSNATNLVANLTTSILASVLSSLPNAAFFEPPPAINSTLAHIPVVAAAAAAAAHNQGTLLSPIKSHTNSFVRVEDFLTPASSKPGLVISQPIMVPGQNQACLQMPSASIPAVLGNHLSLQANSNSNNAVSLPSLGSLVNQKPIPAVFELGAHPRLVQCASSNQLLSGLSTFNPNSFLTGPAQHQQTLGMSLGELLESTAQGMNVLPMNSSHMMTSNGSPSKRPRLE